MSVKKDDRVEYPVHAYYWQTDGSVVPGADVEEDWRPATVLDVFDHPPHIGEPRWVPEGMDDHHLAAGTVDTVARLRPDDGTPPFDLNIKLLRLIEH